ncbi:MAG: hypothetical protein OHK0045_05990 [Raineya sp.]
MEEGLPQSEVMDLLEDSRGLLWVATNGGGVARFNGRNFKIINQQNGLVYDRVKKIFEDSQKKLWFITERGITLYDGSKFHNYTEKENFSNGTSFEVLEDSKGNLWFWIEKEKGSARLLYWNKNSFTDFTIQQLKLIRDNDVLAIGISTEDELVIQTKKGFFEYKNDKLVESPLNNLLLSIPREKIKLYKQDKNKNIRLIVENPQTKQLELYHYKKGKIEKQYDLGSFVLEDFLYLVEDSQNNIWFSVDKRGFFKLDKQKNIQNFSAKNGLPSNHIDIILPSINGNIWLSSYGKGLINYVGDEFTQFYTEAGLETGLVWAIEQDPTGNLWVGETGEKPLSKFDGEKFYAAPIANDAYIKKINDIAFTKEGTMLVSSSRGVWYYNNNALQNASKLYNLPEDMQMTGIRVTQKGIWFGSYQNGVFFYEIASKKTKWLNVKNVNLVSDLVNDVFEDSQGQIWICTNYGISVYQNDTFKNYSKKEGLPSEYALSASEDKQGNIWIATLGGLLRYSPQNKKFILLGEEKGIASSNIYSVLVDSKNRVWLGTQVGISKINLDEQGNPISIDNYGKNSGFAGLEANERAIFEDKQGNIWFGTVRGLIRYEPNKSVEKKEKIQIDISNVDLFSQKTDWLNEQYKQFHKGLIEWSFTPKNLKLPYDKNYLSFHFEARNISPKKDIRYQWKLEGLEVEWSKPSPKTEVSYTNLPPNKYTFKVRASTADGSESSQEAHYSFEIRPAFWQTSWFFILVFLCIGLIVVIIIRQRFLLIEKQKKNLQVKVAEASKALLEQNDALIEQKREIEVQKANLQQLNATKDRFFSILAHDIKGPLNSLTAFLNIMTNHLDEMSQEDIRFMSSNLNKSVKNLYSLLENVLSWSRSQMGVLEYKYEAVDLHELIEQSIQLLAVSAQNKGIEIVNKAQEGLFAWADCNSIQAVLRNLISNAIKFTSTDGTITISSQAIDNKAVVAVRDTGIGMSQEAMKKIFQIDSRYTTKGTANEVGTGLGLVLVKEFIEKNQGMLKVESQEGKGSNFIFTLPLYQPTAQENDTTSTSQPTGKIE